MPISRSTAGLLALAPLAMLPSCNAAPARATPEGRADVLLYDGAGASANDVEAVVSVVRKAGLSIARADAGEIEALPAAALGRYRLIVVPGGDFIAMSEALGPASVTKLRAAVAGGVPYVGICAGAFVAGRVREKGLGLAEGRHFRFYGAEARGVRKAAVPIAAGGEAPLEQYWEDGPQFAGWGTALARYPDGTPAAAEGQFGRGRVILVGFHAEAPESWRRGMPFRTPADVDNAYAVRLVRAAVEGRPLLRQ